MGLLLSGATSLASKIDAIDGQLKQASENQVTQLFLAGIHHYRDFIRHELSLQSPQVAMLVAILSRDGNCIAREVWVEQLFAKEHQRILSISEKVKQQIAETDNLSDLSQRGARLALYERCFREAYENDLRANREARISDDERSVLVTLAEGLGLSGDELFALEHTVVPIPESGLSDSLGVLKDLGIVFIRKRTHEVLVPEEIVWVLHEIQGRALSDKLYLRVLRSLSDPELSLVLRSHGQVARGVDRSAKIQFILRSSVSVNALLANEIHKPDISLQQKKDRVSKLIEELYLAPKRKGVTLSDRIELLVSCLKEGLDKEFEVLRADPKNTGSSGTRSPQKRIGEVRGGCQLSFPSE